MNRTLEDIVPTRNVLSISSHVVHGHVGNDSIQFPLNLRNWNVDTINTTNLSNHAGHGKLKGSKTDSNTISDIFQGLKDQTMLKDYDALIVGYVASESNLDVLWNEILPAFNGKEIVVMDPILGDNGRVYVDPKIHARYEHFLSLNKYKIDVLTPNGFEMEQLTGVKIASWDSLSKSLDIFFKKYSSIRNVVVTSVDISGSLYCIGSDAKSTFYYKVDEIDALFSGSGDLFLGLLTDEYFNTRKLSDALGKTVSVVESVLKLSYAIVSNESKTQKLVNGKLYIPDLKLIESRKLITSKVEDISVNFI